MVELIRNTYSSIKSHIIRTPLELCNLIPGLEKLELYMKLENKQVTDSFKYRGVQSKMFYLQKGNTIIKQIVGASTGNHAAALIYAASLRSINVSLFAPKTISEAKLEYLQSYDADLRISGNNSAETEVLAREYAREHKFPFFHPYSDRHIISGQGTIGLELAEQLPDMDAIFIPVGGGGLISGIASYLKLVLPKVQIIGCQPLMAPEMALSVERGGIVPPKNLYTIADGVSGGLDPNAMTFAICKSMVDEFVLLREEEIKQAVYLIYKHTNMIVEPAAALSVAAIIKQKDLYVGKKIVAIISGKRIAESLFKQIVKRYEPDNK